MAFDDENEHGDELEDFGEELSSDYKEETEEGLGEEGEEIEEEVSFEVEETVTPAAEPAPAAAAAPKPAPAASKKAPAKKKPAKKAKPKAKKPVEESGQSQEACGESQEGEEGRKEARTAALGGLSAQPRASSASAPLSLNGGRSSSGGHVCVRRIAASGGYVSHRAHSFAQQCRRVVARFAGGEPSGRCSDAAGSCPGVCPPDARRIAALAGSLRRRRRATS